MTCKPEGTLLQSLVQSGLSQFLQGFTINDSDFARFRQIADTQFPLYNDEQKDSWAKYACLTSPDCAAESVLRVEGVDEKGRVPVIAKTLHMIHTPLPIERLPPLPIETLPELRIAELPGLSVSADVHLPAVQVNPLECTHKGIPDTLEVRVQELPVMRQKMDPVECKHTGIPGGFELRVRAVPVEPITLQVEPFVKQAVKWLLAVLYLLLVLGIVHEIRAETLKPIGIPEKITLLDHDEFCLAAKQAGTPVSGSNRCGGLVYINCSTNMTCTFSGMTLTLSSSGGGGGGTVTSFSAGNLSPLFTTSVATATTTPALSFTLSNAGAYTVFGNPTSGAAAPAFTSTPIVGSVGSLVSIGVGIGGADRGASIYHSGTEGFLQSLHAGTAWLPWRVQSSIVQFDLNGSTNTASLDTTAMLTLGLAGTTTGSLKFVGTTSGSATVGVAAAAGTPARLDLPTATGGSGTVLSSDGGTPQQLSWVTRVSSVSGTAAEIDSTGGATPVLSLPASLTFTGKTVTNGTFTTPIISGYTVAGLPAAGTAGRVAVVTDASAAGSCTSGGGSAIAFCRDSGAAWVPLGDGGGGGAGDIEAVGSCTSGECFTSGSPSASLVLNNATSGTVTIQTVTGALGTRTISFPAETGTVCTTGSVCSGYSSVALVSSGTSGTGPAYIGDDATAARSDHDHRSIHTITWYFAGTPVTGVANLTLVLPEGIVNPAITDMRVTVNTTSASSSAFNIQRCTADCTGTTPTFADIYSSNLTLNANTRTVAKTSAPDQNVSGLAAGDQFKADLTTIGASLADVTITMSVKWNTTN